MIGYTIDYIIITHSGGVSLQLTKEEIYNNFMQLFLPELGILLKRIDCIRKKYCCVPVDSQTCKMEIRKVSNLYR